MRHPGFSAAVIAIAFLAVACGPDPNAHLPYASTPGDTGGAMVPVGTGGVHTGTGGTVSSDGGTTGSGGASVVPPGKGGAAGSSPFGNGGAGGTTKLPASGGTAGGSPSDSGGAAGGTTSPGGSSGKGSGGITSPIQGGASGTGGRTGFPSQGGAGGSATPSSGPLSSYTFPAGDEPCTPAMDVSGGQINSFKTKDAFCFRTADDFSDYGCNNTDGRTLKINGTPVTKCGGQPPAKLGSFYYFDFSAGTFEYAGVSWYCSMQSCMGAHAVPSPCGKYPTWQSGATVAPCSDTGTTPSGAAGASGAGIDAGS